MCVLKLIQYSFGMAQIVFMDPFVMFWPISSPPKQIYGSSTLSPMPEQALHLVLSFTIDFHRVWRGS